MNPSARPILLFALVCALFAGACGSDSEDQANRESGCDMAMCMACLDEIATSADPPPAGEPLCEAECGECTAEAEAEEDQKSCADGTTPPCAD